MAGRNASASSGLGSRPTTPPQGIMAKGLSLKVSPPHQAFAADPGPSGTPGMTFSGTGITPPAGNGVSHTISRMHSMGAADFARLTEAGEVVAGVLSKWVNYGKGWQERLFVLEKGVLSYYKVHGSGCLALGSEKARRPDMKIIGEDARKLLKKIAPDDERPKPLGLLHLEVSTLRNSTSDERKFYVYSGTKTVYLRADSERERGMWMEALESAKASIQRQPSLAAEAALLAPIPVVAVSTESLRSRLVEANVPEPVVREAESVMRQELDVLQQTLQMEMHKGQTLREALRTLEAEKVELETTVVDESARKKKKAPRGSRATRTATDDSGGGSDSLSGSEDENQVGKSSRGNAADSDDEAEQEEVFFESEEFFGPVQRTLSVKSLRRMNSAGLQSPSSEDGEAASELEYNSACGSLGGTPRTLGASPSTLEMDKVGLHWPGVKRRARLPEPKQREKSVSLWSIIRENVGKDLTRVCLPVYFNQPTSSLQKCFEDLEYSYLLDRAYEYGQRGDSLMRILNVAAFAVSGYSSTQTAGDSRTTKPFNPLLGETYEADFPDKGLRFFSEKVSHHPTILACHCVSKGGWKFYGDTNLKSKFWGRSIQLEPVGTLTLEFDDGEIFQWSKVTTTIYNLIIGKLSVDHYGLMKIQGNRDLSCRLKFQEQTIIERNPHQVRGFVQDSKGEKLATVFGKWDDAMFFIRGDASAKPRANDPALDAELLWQRSPPPDQPARYGLSPFAITLNEILPGMEKVLPPTDSRLRPDQRHLENGEYDEANSEKLRLEQKQRRARKLQERGWQPQWFRQDEEGGTFKYIGGYWEAREARDWSGCPNIFGQDPADNPVETLVG